MSQISDNYFNNCAEKHFLSNDRAGCHSVLATAGRWEGGCHGSGVEMHREDDLNIE